MASFWSELTESLTQSIEEASKVINDAQKYDILNFDEMAVQEEILDNHDDDYSDGHDTIGTKTIIFKDTYAENVHSDIQASYDVGISVAESHFDELTKNLEKQSDVDAAVDDYANQRQAEATYSSVPVLKLSTVTPTIIVHDTQIEPESSLSAKSKSRGINKYEEFLNSRPIKKKEKKTATQRKKKQLDFFGLTTVPEASHQEDAAQAQLAQPLPSMLTHFDDMIITDDEPLPSTSIDPHLGNSETLTDQTQVATKESTNVTEFSLQQLFAKSYGMIEDASNTVNSATGGASNSTSSPSTVPRTPLRFTVDTNKSAQEKSFFDNLDEVDLNPNPAATLNQLDLQRILYPKIHSLNYSLYNNTTIDITENSEESLPDENSTRDATAFRVLRLIETALRSIVNILKSIVNMIRESRWGALRRYLSDLWNDQNSVYIISGVMGVLLYTSYFKFRRYGTDAGN